MSQKAVTDALMYLDHDGDGLVDYNDVLTVLRSLGVNYNSTQEAEAMKKLGVKDDSKIPCQQLVAPLSAAVAAVNPRKVLTDMFKNFDRLGDGTIAEKELSEVLRCLGELLSEKEREGLCQLASKGGKIHYATLIEKLCAA